MDRFLMKLSVGYPSRQDEAEILKRRLARGKDDADVAVITNPSQVIAMQNTVETIHVDPSLVDYLADVICRTREHPDVYVGSSPRGTQAMLKGARAYAAMKGRTFVTPDDIKHLAPHILAHRLILKPEARIRGVKATTVLADVLRAAPVPTG
jgi:MoxR-like ATPase